MPARKEKEQVESVEPKLGVALQPKPDTVKVKVLVGSLQWEGGVYSKGDVFEVPRERAEKFDKTSVAILE